MKLEHECGSAECRSCEQAVTRAYRELRESGQDDLSAFRSALRILDLRHPERSREEHFALVFRWLSEAFDR
jgi:ferredoxin